jgi:hypothetical protein
MDFWASHLKGFVDGNFESDIFIHLLDLWTLYQIHKLLHDHDFLSLFVMNY